MKTLVIIYKICGEEQWFTHFEFLFNDKTELEIVDGFIRKILGKNSKCIGYGVDSERMSFADYKDIDKKRRFEVRFFIIEEMTEKKGMPDETKKFINELMSRNLVH